MRGFPEQRLISRLAPLKAVEPDRTTIQVHLRADQPVGPVSVHFEGPPQHLGPAAGVGPPQVHDPTLKPGQEVQTPAPRDRVPMGRRLQATGPVTSQRRDSATRLIG
jgi:hypothetical protein